MSSNAATKRRDKAIREASKKGTYVDPARHLGTSKKAVKKKARRLKADKARQVSNRKSPTKEEMEAQPGTEIYVPEDNPVAAIKSRAERMGIMFFALQTSIEQAAEEYAVAKDTIYRWFKEEGGLAEVRAFLASKVEASLHSTIDMFLKDMPRRLKGLDDEEYFDTFRTLLASAEKAGLFRDAPPASTAPSSRRQAGSSETSPEGTEGNGIHFHITQPPASEPTSPAPKAKAGTPGEAPKENPSVFDDQ